MTRRPSRLMEIARVALAALFAMGAIANVIMVAVQPDLYQDFASLALVPFYRQAWEQFVLPNLVVAIVLLASFAAWLATGDYRSSAVQTLRRR